MPIRGQKFPALTTEYAAKKILLLRLVKRKHSRCNLGFNYQKNLKLICISKRQDLKARFTAQFLIDILMVVMWKNYMNYVKELCRVM